jgi:hypothetical protein
MLEEESLVEARIWDPTRASNSLEGGSGHWGFEGVLGHVPF